VAFVQPPVLPDRRVRTPGGLERECSGAHRTREHRRVDHVGQDAVVAQAMPCVQRLALAARREVHVDQPVETFRDPLALAVAQEDERRHDARSYQMV
jgi:hypothetical protein